MNKFFTFTLAALTSLYASAQEEGIGRMRIENTTDYSQPVVSKHHRIGKPETAPLPCVGSPKIPVILVQFENQKFTIEDTDEKVNESYNKFCNGSGIPGQRYQVNGGIWGSISDYFIEQSDSLFQPELTVIGPITLTQGYEYYGKDSNTQKDVNITQFYSDACRTAANQYNVDWNDFDNNKDGKVDFVFFIYAGCAQNSNTEDPNLIWPKESSSGVRINVDSKTIYFASYGCTSEMFGQRNREGKIELKQDGTGTMIHELSHGLGLPDFYNYSAFGMDFYDVMDSGCYQMLGNQPCCYSSYERDFMGWRKLKTLENEEKYNLTLYPIEKDGVGYVLKNPGKANGTEYFILENRQNINFDTYLGCRSSSSWKNYGASKGLFITHVDYLESAWTGNNVNTDISHQRFTIVPADGELISSYNGYSQEYYLSLRADPYPGYGNVTEMSNYSVFNGTFYDKVTDITQQEDGTITLKINGGIDDPVIPDAISDIATTEKGKKEIYNAQGQKINSLCKGVNIVKYSTGETKKVIKK